MTDVEQTTDFAGRRIMMVDTQVRPNDVTKFPIIEAMLTVRREAFVPPGKAEAAYVGENLDIGGGRVVLEARTLAKLLDALDLQPGDHVLDIGCGLGYSTAVMARMAATVVGVEDDAARAEAASAALAAEGVTNAAVVTARLAEGAPARGPYDIVILQGAVETVPDALVAQVKDGGRIGCLFMEKALGIARIGHKSNDVVSWHFAFNASAPILPGFAEPRVFAL
jgi:protein-L-isoaspartate(D-aspartate) O-methyltransferase